jgi:hypothetical protein
MESADADCENHICKQLSDLQHQLDTATKEKEAIFDDLTRLLEGRQRDNGEWVHLVYCNGDRRKPPGITGYSCCCRPSGQKQKDATTALASLAEGIQKYGRHSDECPVGRDAKFPRCACGHSKSNHRHPSIEAPGCRFCRCETFTARGDLSCTCGLSALLASSEAT